MKAYEKWYKENLYDRTETKKAWSAALEWVINECQEDGWGDSIALNTDKIMKELEDI